jgi:glycosyltransferase involved in cell wall biosynthesis
MLGAVSRVLFIAYHFPPVGGAGVQRATKFVRYLPEFGWDAEVVTGPLGSIGDSYTTDETLSEELPAGLEVRRLRGPEPVPATRWRRRAERWLRLPTAWSRWWIDGVTEAGRQAPAIDLVFATMSPFESCSAAQRLSRHHGVPWVADLRDPWAMDEMRVYTTGLHRRLELRRMERSLRSAEAIVMNTAEAAERLRSTFPSLARKQIHAIPNGFDASDFGARPPRGPEGPFRIVHTGYLHTEFGLRHRRKGAMNRILGGTLGDVDILTRSHVFLLEAVERLFDRRPDLREAVVVELAGGMDRHDEEAIRVDWARTYGYVEHAEAIRLMQSADLLFLPMHDVEPPRRAGIVPGKTYEYLASGSPILAAIPDGDARDLLERAGSAFVSRPADVAGMSRLIEEQVDRRASGLPQPSPRPEVLASYERRHLTERLAGVLDAARR